MGAQRAETADVDSATRAAAWEDLRRLRAEIATANPDMSDDDWEHLADRLAADLDDALRAHVSNQNAGFEQRS